MLSIRPVEEVAGAVVIPAVNSMVSVIILEDPNDGTYVSAEISKHDMDKILV